MKKTNRILAVLMTIVMVMALVPALAFAKGESTGRPLTKSEREAKIEAFMSFNSRLREMEKQFADTDYSTKDANDPYATARIVVKSDKPVEDANALAAVSGYNDWTILQYATPEEAEAACKRFSSANGVEWAEPDEIMTVCATPGSNNFNSWGYGASHVNMYEYNQWLYSQYGNDLTSMPTVIVAVVDTGADLDHPYLVNRLVQGYNVAAGNNNPEDGHSHGTHVAGTVVDGTFTNVKIMPIKVLSDSGSGSTVDVALGMEYGYLHGADVENLSLGGGCDGGESHHMMAEVVDFAYDNGTTVCVAAGNESDDAVNHCPANVKRCITVAATTSSGSLAYFSNTGADVDVAAPGDDIYSSVPGGGYGYKSGTSMACPHVAAVAAQIKTAHPEMTADEVATAIKGRGTGLSSSNVGTGLVKLAANMYALDDAANAEGWHNYFVSTGSNGWTVDNGSLVSGNAGSNGTTSIVKTELTVGKGQTLTFDYKISSEDNDYLNVKANGATLFSISGEHGWQTQTVTIPGTGSVRLTFEYAKSAQGSAGQDKAWIRNVKIERSLTAATNLTGGEVEFASTGAYPWVVNTAEDAAMSGNAGVDNSVSTMTATGQFKKGMLVVFKYKVSAAQGDVFTVKLDENTILTSQATDGWTAFECTVPFTGQHTFTFEFSKNASESSGDDCALVKTFNAYHTFESAVNGSDNFLPFDNETDYPWGACYDYAVSTNWSESNSQGYFTLTLNMNQGETLSFRYRANSEYNYDFFRFYVDGVKQVETSGDTGWTNYTFTASTTKTYNFKWSYEKDSSVDGNGDEVYVDDVVYSGTVGILGDANGSGSVTIEDALLTLRFAMSLVPETAIETGNCDIDGNGSIDLNDALAILRMAIGLA